jgi:hypothetical protein
MQGVLATSGTVFIYFYSLRVIPLILGGVVGSFFAITASEVNENSTF